MSATYEKNTHCFMHCYECPEEYDNGFNFSQYPFAVVVDDDRFKALFPSDPNDPDNPTTNLCVMYHGCCYCNHYYVLMPPNVDGAEVSAAVSTGCDDCEAGEGAGCKACGPVPDCASVDPVYLAELQIVSWTGAIDWHGFPWAAHEVPYLDVDAFHSIGTYEWTEWVVGHAPPVTLIPYAWNCFWGSSYYNLLTLTLVDETYWELRVAAGLVGEYRIMLLARKTKGATPEGTYIAVEATRGYRYPVPLDPDFYGIQHTLNNIVIEMA